MRFELIVGIVLALPVSGLAQPFTALGLNDKLTYHLNQSVGPLALVGNAAYAGILQGAGTPPEWGQGESGYGKRFGSSVACSGIHSALAFGLDSGLHQDPRYFRSAGGGFWRRTGHAFRSMILTHTDKGTETLSVWRFGSAYGAAYLSNQWYPDRLNTVGLGFAEGTLQLGFDFASNLGSEFWPDFKRKILRRKI
ncbi:MAG: hypothetical protein P4L56_24950 [Candidatus Sulfopaludibacter sp.]|nr:hypothetical protein [Candidatus Sulfopaludibacter sp.]